MTLQPKYRQNLLQLSVNSKVNDAEASFQGTKTRRRQSVARGPLPGPEPTTYVRPATSRLARGPHFCRTLSQTVRNQTTER